MDATFRAAEAHGIRAILGKVMMDRLTYDPTIEPSTILERSLRESATSPSAGTAPTDGRLGYAVTPRFAVSCTAELLARSAALARELGCWWQTHVSEDAGEIAEVARLFPEARDYVDVYDRAGGLGRADDPRPRDPPLGPRRRRGSPRRGRGSPTARPRTCSSAPA